MKLYYEDFDSVVGRLKLVADDEALVAVLWENEKLGRVKLQAMQRDSEHVILRKCAAQLTEYFAGNRKNFDLPLKMRGTDFQIEVWRALQKIPFGKTLSYSELAREIGREKAVRAVGAANGRNPLSIIVPCHRVIGASGKLVGFAGGIENKTKLLQLEQEVL